MSDIAGPPLPKPIEPTTKPAARSAAVTRDQQRPETQARNDRGDTSAKNEQSETTHGREPAVSISASAAHLHVGDSLKEKVSKIDQEGRPIIVTEKATYALKPDAGLRPGDDVKLEIVEAGKQVSAHLHEMNGRPIDPPIQLSLIVIAIHAASDQEKASVQQLPQQHAALPPTTPAFQYSSHQSLRPAAQDDASLAAIIAGRSLPNKGGPEIDPNIQGSNRDIFQHVTHNPDPISGKSSTSDLAMLIASQQKASTPTASSTTPLNPPPFSSATSPSHHLLPDTPFAGQQGIPGPTTEGLSTRQAQGLSQGIAAGLGKPIQAFDFSGTPQLLQNVDVSVSQVPPAQLAEVIQVRPLPADEARKLPLPMTALQGGAVALAVVETTRANLIAPLTEVSALAGEMVKISPAEAGASEPTSASGPATTFQAKLDTPGSDARRAVTVALGVSPENKPANSLELTINAVHTQRAFLTAQGPVADLRLETARGDILITLPNTLRPMTDESLLLLSSARESDPLAAASPAVAAAANSTATAAALAGATALSGAAAHAWPTFEQTYALVGDADPALAAEMASKGAQGGAKLTNSLLFFLSAAGRSNPSAWIGADAERLIGGRDPSLLDRFKSELSQMMTAATDAAAEWRPVLLPFDARGGDLSLIALLLGNPQRPVDEDGKGAGGQEKEDAEGEGQRFLLEVQFSVLGSVQLDGVIKQQNFDLSLRSEKAFTEALRQDVRKLFEAALGANGYSGALHIIDGAPFKIDVQKILAETFPRS